MRKQRVEIETDRYEMYRCKVCGDVTYRVVWISTEIGTINTGWVLTHCESCDKVRWQLRE